MGKYNDSMKAYPEPQKSEHHNFNYYVWYTDGDGKRKRKWFTTHTEANYFPKWETYRRQMRGLQ